MNKTHVPFPKRSLNAELGAFQLLSEREWPSETLQVMQKAVDELDRNGGEYNGLHIGNHAPRFTLYDQDGTLVDAQTLWTQGPLVLHFFRGMW